MGQRTPSPHFGQLTLPGPHFSSLLINAPRRCSIFIGNLTGWRKAQKRKPIPFLVCLWYAARGHSGLWVLTRLIPWQTQKPMTVPGGGEEGLEGRSRSLLLLYFLALMMWRTVLYLRHWNELPETYAKIKPYIASVLSWRHFGCNYAKVEYASACPGSSPVLCYHHDNSTLVAAGRLFVPKHLALK